LEAERRGVVRREEDLECDEEREAEERDSLVDRFLDVMFFLHDNQDFNTQVSSLFFLSHRKTQCYVTTP
jgi:hypothetical protein